MKSCSQAMVTLHSFKHVGQALGGVQDPESEISSSQSIHKSRVQ